MNDPLLQIRQVAERLGMTEVAARRAVERGLLPVVRIGRRIRVKQSDLERLIAENTSVPSKS
jgi:excisionase family DNA binding protein